MPLRAATVVTTVSATRWRTVPTAAWLGAIVGVSAVLRFALAASTPGPVVFPDEIVYSELAKGIASSGDFLVRDTAYAAWTYGPLYVVLIAPAYWIASLPDAYLVAKAIGAVVMSLAAIPAYFLARRLLDRHLALNAAALTLLIPAVAQSSRLMTETLFLPVFLTAVLACVRCLERPTRARQLAVLGVFALAVMTRAEGVVLVPAFATAAALLTWIELREGGEVRLRALLGGLGAFRIVWAGLAICVLTALGLTAARGAYPTSLLGAHEVLLERLRPLEAPKWILYHVAGLDVAVGVLPALAFLLLARSVMFGAEHPAARPFFVVAVSVAAWLVMVIGLYATQPHAPAFRERYLFYLEPLLLMAMLAWLRAGRARVDRLTTALVGTVAALPLTLYLGSLFGHVYEAPGLVLWVSLRNAVGDGALLAGLGAVAAGSTYVLLRRPTRSGVLTAAVVLYVVASSLAASAAFRADSRGALAAGIGKGEPTWIDQAVGPEASVAVIWSGRKEQWDRYRVVWMNEFFNRSVRRIYHLDEVPLELAETRVRVRHGSFVLADGTPLDAEYVLSDGPAIAGRRVAAQPEVGLVLYRVGGMVRLASPAAAQGAW